MYKILWIPKVIDYIPSKQGAEHLAYQYGGRILNIEFDRLSDAIPVTNTLNHESDGCYYAFCND